jgi:hypothetical protein
MNRRIRISSCILVSALALAACTHKNGSGQDSGQAGIAALGSASPSPGDHYSGGPDSGSGNGNGTDTGSGSGSGNGSGNGGGTGGGTGSGGGSGSGGHSSPSPSTNPNAPRIVTFTVTNVVCPDYPEGGGFQQPGSATLTWKIANADTVDVLMDGGLWQSYPGSQGSDTLNFSCTLDPPARKVSHTYTVVIKNTNVKKTITATATSNPSH